MKTLLSGLAIVLLLVGCARSVERPAQSGEWILESYTADKGYVLRKDGVKYVADCGYYFFGPVSQDEYHRGEPQLSAMPGKGLLVQKDSGECTAILAYLHKPVPFQQYASYPPDRLFFLKQQPGSTYIEGITEFTIIEAK
jgi:hypothetical protein